MSPDDPRHGEYRGYLQHRKDNEPPCDRCVVAAFRRNKAMKRRLDAGIRHRVPIGDEAWRAINTISPKTLALASGIRRATLTKLRARTTGPTSIVMLSTRTAILNSYRQAFTPIGLARRLQAITAMGWSMKVVADETPFTVDAFKRVRRATSRQFVQHELGECIVAAYEKYGMTPAPNGVSSARTRRWAESEQWLTALAWDDGTIDDPKARPIGVPTKADIPAIIDESRIQRRIDGDRTVRLHRGESAEIVRRMLADGLNTGQINRLTGIKVERYVKVSEYRQRVAA